jgi:proteasome accessory factor A
VEFTLSPRAGLFTQAVSHDSTAARGIFHTREEALACEPWRRLHVTCGESLCSDVATVLKLGSTALILATIGAGWTVGEALVLQSPVQALKSVAADPS